MDGRVIYTMKMGGCYKSRERDTVIKRDTHINANLQTYTLVMTCLKWRVLDMYVRMHVYICMRACLRLNVSVQWKTANHITFSHLKSTYSSHPLSLFSCIRFVYTFTKYVWNTACI